MTCHVDTILMFILAYTHYILLVEKCKTKEDNLLCNFIRCCNSLSSCDSSANSIETETKELVIYNSRQKSVTEYSKVWLFVCRNIIDQSLCFLYLDIIKINPCARLHYSSENDKCVGSDSWLKIGVALLRDDQKENEYTTPSIHINFNTKLGLELFYTNLIIIGAFWGLKWLLSPSFVFDTENIFGIPLSIWYQATQSTYIPGLSQLLTISLWQLRHSVNCSIYSCLSFSMIIFLLFFVKSPPLRLSSSEPYLNRHGISLTIHWWHTFQSDFLNFETTQKKLRSELNHVNVRSNPKEHHQTKERCAHQVLLPAPMVVFFLLVWAPVLVVVHALLNGLLPLISNMM